MRKYDLVCFDLDGTLIEEENGNIFWERMSELIHGTRKVSNGRMARYRKGELSVDEWADIDLSEWKQKGITRRILVREARHSKLNPGTIETLNALKGKGCKLGIISGSVDLLLNTVFPDHPFDNVFMNKLFFDSEDKLASWEKNPYANHRKDEALKIIAEKEKIPLKRTVFVGDHLNDISAAKIAGLSISLNSKSERLNQVCDIVIEGKDVREILKHISK